MKKHIILIVIFTFIFLSCKQESGKDAYGNDPKSNTEEQGTIDDVPSIETIKSDLLGKSVKLYNTNEDFEYGKWNFDKLEEFDNVEIVNSKLSDDYNLNLEINIKLVDYSKNRKDVYSGNLTLNYYRSNKDQGYWVFQDVSGRIKYDGEDESYTSTSDYNNQSESETSTSDNNSNDNNRLIICPNCKGTGQSYKRCVDCQGKGEIIKDYHSDSEGGSDYRDCYRCAGRGEVLKTCYVCYGKGRVKEYE
jgi:hypothetical protein